MNPLENVQTELAAAMEERAEIDRKIQALQESAKVLEPIYGHPLSTYTLQRLVGVANTVDIKDLGITAAVERVLMLNQSNWLPPTSIRNALKEAGFELTGDNPLASIHQVLKRLVARENSPVVSQEHQGQTLYKFDPNRLNPYGATARSAIEAIAQVSAGAREIFEDMGRKNKRAREIISPLEKRD